MLRPDVVAYVLRLLDEDRLSIRQMSKQLGISRTTIHRIASGERPDRQTRRPRKLTYTRNVLGRRRRCPTCGATVRLPCVACRVRNWMAERDLRWQRRRFAVTSLQTPTGRVPASPAARPPAA